LAFVGSPELVTAGNAGDLSFNPLTDTLINEDGEDDWRRQQVTSCRKMDLMLKTKVFKPAADGSNVEVTVSETSERLQLLAPFMGWKKHCGAKLLIKAFGKCTTDHISMAGPWLRFRGHLDNISNNMLVLSMHSTKKQKVKIN
jgi:aconitate hydratase